MVKVNKNTHSSNGRNKNTQLQWDEQEHSSNGTNKNTQLQWDEREHTQLQWDEQEHTAPMGQTRTHSSNGTNENTHSSNGTKMSSQKVHFRYTLSGLQQCTHSTYAQCVCSTIHTSHRPCFVFQQAVNTEIEDVRCYVGVHCGKGVVKEINGLVLIHGPGECHTHLLTTTESDTVLTHLCQITGWKYLEVLLARADTYVDICTIGTTSIPVVHPE